MHVIDDLTGRSTARLIARSSADARLRCLRGQPLGPDTRVVVQADEVVVIHFDDNFVGPLGEGEHVLQPILPERLPKEPVRGDVFMIPLRSLAVIDLRKEVAPIIRRRPTIRPRWNLRCRVRLVLGDALKFVSEMCAGNESAVAQQIRARTELAFSAFIARMDDEWLHLLENEDSVDLYPRLLEFLREELARVGISVDGVEEASITLHHSAEYLRNQPTPSDEAAAQPAPGVVPASEEQDATDHDHVRGQIIARLKELARLRDIGVLSDEEFGAKKKDLVERL